MRTGALITLSRTLQMAGMSFLSQWHFAGKSVRWSRQLNFSAMYRDPGFDSQLVLIIADVCDSYVQLSNLFRRMETLCCMPPGCGKAILLLTDPPWPLLAFRFAAPSLVNLCLCPPLEMFFCPHKGCKRATEPNAQGQISTVHLNNVSRSAALLAYHRADHWRKAPFLLSYLQRSLP